MVPVLRAQILGAVAIGDEVWLAGGSEAVVTGVPGAAARRSTVDDVATGLEVELGVDVVLLQRGNGAAARASGG